MRYRVLAIVSIVLGTLALATPAAAKWHKAESDRFVIYSDSRGEDLREISQMLERYHVAMELESGRRVEVPSPSNRLTVYMVGSQEDLAELYGARDSNVAGFYLPRANGSVAFVPNPRIRASENARGRVGSRYRRDAGIYVDRSFSILLHEYAHHFLIASARHAMPRWLSEGAAEYFSSARFHEDGSVDIGLPNNERAWEISQASNVPVMHLLDYERYLEGRSRRYSNFYGRSWLLYHYLRFEPDRSGHLLRYWQAVASGADSLEAGEAIFGDIDRLEKDVTSYGRKRSMSGMRFSAADISIGSVRVTELSEGHEKMMDVIMRSKRGVDSEAAREIVVDARRVAEDFPGDAHVLTALAEAEYDSGNDDAAIAAAERAISIDPAIPNAYVQKGYALFRKAAESDEPAMAYQAAMTPFQDLNALEADHTQPLIYYYRSFVRRGEAPPEDAKFALERATQLAPFDKGLAVEAAGMKAAEGDPVIARYLLAPVAADPHGGKRGRLARAMMEVLAKVPDGSRVNLSDFAREFDEADETDDADSDD